MNLSVALCTFNGERFLRTQLDSLAAQRVLPTELVVCDDGSSDLTVGIVEEFASRAPFPVHFHRNPERLGSTRNFEQAIRLCKGEVIALCDQDDVWHPQKMERLQAIFESRADVGGVFSNAGLMDGGGAAVPGSLWERMAFTKLRQQRFTAAEAPYSLVRRDTVTGATLAFRSRFVPSLLPISTEWVHDGWIALILASVTALIPVDERLITYRLHEAQQIGAETVGWHTHLSTERKRAIAFHKKSERRWSAMAAKLRSLGIDPHLTTYVEEKAVFYGERAVALESSRGRRLLPAVRRLSAYGRYDKGVASFLRDLLH